MTDSGKSFLVFIFPAVLLKAGAAGYTAGFLLNSAASIFAGGDTRGKAVLASLGDLSMRVGVPMLFWGLLLVSRLQ